MPPTKPRRPRGCWQSIGFAVHVRFSPAVKFSQRLPRLKAAVRRLDNGRRLTTGVFFDSEVRTPGQRDRHDARPPGRHMTRRGNSAGFLLRRYRGYGRRPFSFGSPATDRGKEPPAGRGSADTERTLAWTHAHSCSPIRCAARRWSALSAISRADALSLTGKISSKGSLRSMLIASTKISDSNRP